MSEDAQSVKNHLALAVSVLESIAEQAGIDADGTSLTIDNTNSGQNYGRITLAKLIAKWKEIAQ